MLERYPLLTFLLMLVGVFVFAIVAVWLWFSVGLIWATVLIILGVLAIPWLWGHRPGFLGGGRHY